MTRYRVRYLTEAMEALRSAFLHVRENAGPRSAANWLSRVYASIDQLEIAPRASRDEGFFHGHEFRSKLVISHRVFFTIDEDAQVVHVIDVVHTAQQTRLDEYTS